MRGYFVKRPRYTIEPEEILLDSRTSSAYERLEFAIPGRHIQMFLAAGIAGLLGLLAATIHFQVFKHEYFSAQADRNRLRLVFEAAPRGIIYDRHGVPLVENVEIFDVAALPLNLPKDEKDIARIAETLSKTLGVSRDEIKQKLEAVQKSPYSEPEVIFGNIASVEATALENRKNELTGIKILGRFQRRYPTVMAFSHLLGYTGGITKEDIARIFDAAPKDIVGRAGIELVFDDILRGQKGKEEIEVNAALEVIDMRRRVFPKPGGDVYLTIDAGLQKYLYGTLVSYTSAYGYERAAAVAVHPKTGEVLALVSIPSFDNNRFSEGLSSEEFRALSSKQSKPLFNRAISGMYSPGSAVKPLIAAAALEENIVKPNTLVDASAGEIVVPNPYDPSKPSIYRDWRAHGLVNIERAIAWSSNVYFYTVGGGYGNIKGLGIERIKNYLQLFGFGSATGISLPGEASGLVPDPGLKKKTRPQDPFWRVGDTYITSIGQGDLLVTPIQLAMAHSAIANGGMLLRPKLIRKIGGAETQPTEVIGKDFVSSENFKVVQNGMRLTTTAGSAQSLNVLPFETAGKTGTVQVGGTTRTHAVFSVYAPFVDPVIELVVVVENGGEGSSTAVPIAQDVLLWYWQNRLVPYQNPESGV